jgi:hypothetical protein
MSSDFHFAGDSSAGLLCLWTGETYAPGVDILNICSQSYLLVCPERVRVEEISRDERRRTEYK